LDGVLGRTTATEEEQEQEEQEEQEEEEEQVEEEEEATEEMWRSPSKEEIWSACGGLAGEQKALGQGLEGLLAVFALDDLLW